MTDIEIAQTNIPEDITKLAVEELGIPVELVEMYGKNKAKIDFEKDKAVHTKGNLILVTAMSPTRSGEGKTTVTIGLADALHKIKGKGSTCVTLREPSLGPVFGVKGGACGGGYAQVVPMEDINLHFTGDFHAIGAATNLLAAVIDNHILQGNALQIDPASITWKRCVDMNDRQLRRIVSGLGGSKNGVPREDGFEITVASEIMAVLCLAESLQDLREKLSKITVGKTYQGHPVTVLDLGIAGALCALLKDAIKPNLVQTLEHTPAIIHGGPFANIAHGCNSIIATRFALNHAKYVVTEAGFGSDLGAEKFFDIKCRKAHLHPAVVVVVATIKALKLHGGVPEDGLDRVNVEAVKAGCQNLFAHVDNIRNNFNTPCVVAFNLFKRDSIDELHAAKELCREAGIEAINANPWLNGGDGCIELAEKVVEICDRERPLTTLIYSTQDSIYEKIRRVVQKVYLQEAIHYAPEALKDIEYVERIGADKYPVCIAKTQYSLSDDPAKFGVPEGGTVTVKRVKPCTGAGFNVVYLGDILTMPGLPRHPAALDIGIDAEGKITGLF